MRFPACLLDTVHTFHQTHMPAWVCVRSFSLLQPCTHASGAHRERTGIALLQTPVAGLRAVASRSRNLGSGNSSCYSHGSPRFSDISAATLRQWLRAEREAEKELDWNTVQIFLVGSAPMFPAAGFHWDLLVISPFFISYLEVRLSLSEVKWGVWSGIGGAQLPTFGERIFHLDFSSFSLRLDYFLPPLRRCQVVPWQTQGSGAEARRMLGSLQQPDLSLWVIFLG